MNKQVNRVTNAIADDIRSHERSQKIYSLCFFGSSATSAAACLRLLCLRSSPAPVASGAGAVEAVDAIDRWLRVYCHACIHDPLP